MVNINFQVWEESAYLGHHTVERAQPWCGRLYLVPIVEFSNNVITRGNYFNRPWTCTFVHTCTDCRNFGHFSGEFSIKFWIFLTRFGNVWFSEQSLEIIIKFSSTILTLNRAFPSWTDAIWMFSSTFHGQISSHKVRHSICTNMNFHFCSLRKVD